MIGGISGSNPIFPVFEDHKKKDEVVKVEEQVSTIDSTDLGREVKTTEFPFEKRVLELFAKTDEEFEKELVDLREQFLKIPELNELVKLINSESRLKHDRIDWLLVIFGIKPCFGECFSKRPITIEEFLKKLCKIHSNLHFSSDEKGTVYFSNENTIPYFDPKKFFKEFPYENILAALKATFATGEKENSDLRHQYLSYLFGFGPTWHCFKGSAGKTSDTPEAVYEAYPFSDEHYRQVGTGFKSAEGRTAAEVIELGKIHYQLEAFIRRSDWQTVCTQVNQYNLYCFADSYAQKSEYMQKSFQYRLRVFKLFAITT